MTPYAGCDSRKTIHGGTRNPAICSPRGFLVARIHDHGSAGQTSTCKYCWHSSVVSERVRRVFASATMSSNFSKYMRTICRPCSSKVAETTRVPSGVNSTSKPPGKVSNSCPVSKSNIFNSRFPALTASNLPSGLNPTALIQPEVPENLSFSSPEATSHTTAVPVQSTIASHFPSGLNQKLLSKVAGPGNVNSFWPAATSQM